MTDKAERHNNGT